ncbi:MAG: hypothetical protein IKD70_07550, partial [Eggerthellaceae bacterium]|nr:hypothetical protein [Eggerthellaceae bacterium]
LVAAAEVVFGKTDPRYVYSAYIFQKNDKLAERLCAQIIDVGGHLNETFFQRTHSVVFTSATLTVGGSFDAFSRAMGLNANEYSQTRFKHLDSSFDFDGNMVIYVPTDIRVQRQPARVPGKAPGAPDRRASGHPRGHADPVRESGGHGCLLRRGAAGA